ncbi:hypothetical protein KY285_030876 [Solanum tuberosum]|nr:hypothetical protein KY285_030876 [Solanum tuberosum]
MNFTEMNLRAVNRNRNRDDMMNFDEIPHQVQVDLTVCCAILSSTYGSFMQYILVAGGKLTVLSYVASLFWIYFTPPGRMNMRFLLTMLVTYSFGASVSASTIYLFKIKQDYVLRLWAAITVSTGNFLYRAIKAAERSEINFGFLKYCYIVMISGTVLIHLDIDTIFWFITIIAVQIVFMAYLMIYSQEILYDTNLGNLNFLNCAFTVLFHLPGIVIHAAILYLQGTEIELHEHN